MNARFVKYAIIVLVLFITLSSLYSNVTTKSSTVHSVTNKYHAATASTCKDKHTVKWHSLIDHAPQKKISVNPFGKSKDAHCREDSQCKSNSCNRWYCN